jgi:hypothetical protein
LFAQTTPSPAESLVARCDLPVIDLFNPLPGDVLPTGSYLISGLALDPMADDGTSGIDQVAFFLGDRDQGGVPLGTVAPSSSQRQADFSLSVTVPTTAAGKPTQLEAFAHSVLTGKQTEVSLPVAVGRSPDPTTPMSDAVNNTVNTNPGVLPDTCAAADAAPPVLATPAPATPSALPNLPIAKVTGSGGTPLFGEIMGSVSVCQGGAEQPVAMVSVQVQGTSATGITDMDGIFAVMQVPAPGTYTISVSDGGQTASRMYVPVAPGETIDIGTLQLGSDPVGGCG